MKKKYFPFFSLIFFAFFGYFLTHLIFLTRLPVFADEAIYIRWAQLIIDDWQRYLFFPLNDGKTPLFIWFLVPFQFLFEDNLFAGRFVSVFVGFFQVIVTVLITKSLGGKKFAQFFSALLVTILPFWLLHHRLALMDGTMTLFVSFYLLFLIQITNQVNHIEDSKINKLFSSFTVNQLLKILSIKKFFLLLLSGCFFGFALLTKLPAILIVPTTFLLISLLKPVNTKKTLFLSFQILISLLIGIVVFSLLKLHPAFGQLFSRGNDFLYPWKEVLFRGLWKETIINFRTYGIYFITYLTLPVVFFNIYGLLSQKTSVKHRFLIGSGLLFSFPIMILGKVVYPRYLLPVALFSTLSASLVFEEIVIFIQNTNALVKKSIISLAFAILLAHLVSYSGIFCYFLVTNPDKTPFVDADKQQYLFEWSSGHGILQTVEYIKKEAQTKRVAVATEGFFGTLPDGLLLYFHNQDVRNIYIEGIGYPVSDLPPKFIDKAQFFDQILLVANSHRVHKTYPSDILLAEFCRPENAPCLQIWDVTQRLDSLK